MSREERRAWLESHYWYHCQVIWDGDDDDDDGEDDGEEEDGDDDDTKRGVALLVSLSGDIYDGGDEDEVYDYYYDYDDVEDDENDYVFIQHLTQCCACQTDTPTLAKMSKLAEPRAGKSSRYLLRKITTNIPNQNHHNELTN